MLYRRSISTDVLPMACIRAREWGGLECWRTRIAGYLEGEIRPRHALAPRRCYVVVEESSVVGFVAGHLTRRYGCEGELEWINVIAERRGSGVASELLRRLAGWFVEQKAFRVCVDVDPSNTTGRAFYTRHGAERLNAHWLVWNDISNVISAR